MSDLRGGAGPTVGASEAMGRRPRIAYLTYSSAAHDARTQRMARWAVMAGFDVVVYARREGDLPEREERDGYRVVRVHWLAWREFLVLNILQRVRRRALAVVGGAIGRVMPAERQAPVRPLAPASGSWVHRLRRAWAITSQVVVAFPVRPLVWRHGLQAVAEPADIWHGMWAGSLPASTSLAHRHGGRTIYDSRDVYMESRDFSRSPRVVRRLLAGLERRWATRVDRVLTVNEPYADLIARQLRVPRPAVVMNCPERWTPPDPRPDRIREVLGLPAGTAIVLYQGLLITDRGIEQAMDAILEVPDAALVLLGWGKGQAMIARRAAAAPYEGRVFLLPPVPPDELLVWTASADVSVMAIQPTTINHRYTTPQKLFESLAAGTPVVASDLPGMADIVRETGAGVLVDPTSPSAIAAGIRSILERPAEERDRLRATVLAAAHAHYTWEAQIGTLASVYEALLPGDIRAGLRVPAGVPGAMRPADG